MGDGGALAFFSFADDEVYRKCQAAGPPEIGNFHHIAFKVDDEVYDELVGRLKAANEALRETDHGYCRSMYCTSPDGLIVEFTVDPPDAAAIDRLRRAGAHADLARWIAGPSDSGSIGCDGGWACRWQLMRSRAPGRTHPPDPPAVPRWLAGRQSITVPMSGRSLGVIMPEPHLLARRAEGPTPCARLLLVVSPRLG